MKQSNPALRRVGTALIVVGIADICFMIYCIANQQSYSSSFNIFAVIGGVLLLRGNLTAVRVVTFFAAFMFVGLLGATFGVFPFMKPLTLWSAEFRQHPISTAAAVVFAVAAICFLGWIVRSLRSEAVISTLRDAGRKTSPPILAYIAGVALALVLSVTLQLTINGDRGRKAIAVAQEKFGPSYQYAPLSIQWSGSKTTATLDAYNEHEIKVVSVEWSE